MDELKNDVRMLALEYWNESAGVTDSGMEQFPLSIVAFVLEYAIGYCHFPPHFSEEKKAAIMTNFKNSLAMACVDMYAKAGAEGEKTHNENGVQRTYNDSYIDKNLLDKLPNYVTVL